MVALWWRALGAFMKWLNPSQMEKCSYANIGKMQSLIQILIDLKSALEIVSINLSERNMIVGVNVCFWILFFGARKEDVC